MAVDPLECAAWLIRCPPAFRDNELVWSAISQAAKTNPDATIELVRAAPQQSLRLNGLSNILRAIESADVHRLLPTLSHLFDTFGLAQLHREQLASQMLSSLALTAPSEALSLLGDTPYVRSPEICRTTQANILASWFTQDAGAAQLWMDSLSAHQRSSLGTQVLRALSKESPSLALELASGIPEGLEKTQAISDVLASSLHEAPGLVTEYLSQADPNAAWLASARSHVAREALHAGDLTTAEEMASAIINPMQRTHLWRSLAFSIAINDPYKAWELADQVGDPIGAQGFRNSALRLLVEKSPTDALNLVATLDSSIDRMRLYNSFYESFFHAIPASQLEPSVSSEFYKVHQRRQEFFQQD